MTKSGFDQQGEPKEAFTLLGLEPGATFEQIQKARDEKLLAAGEDMILKAKIEASYDLLLMESLKARQSGKISNEAFSASEKEAGGFQNKGNFLKNIFDNQQNVAQNQVNNRNLSTQVTPFYLPEGDGLIIRLALGILVITLLLVSPDRNIQLILSLATLGLFISQINRGRRIFQSLGWSVVFLSSGYILGGLVVSGLAPVTEHSLNLSVDKIEALPPLLLLWVGALFLA